MLGGERLGKAALELTTDQSGLDAGLAQAKGKAQNFVSRTGTTLMGLGRSLSQAGTKMTLAVTLPLVGLGAAIFKVGSDFEHTLSQIVGLVGISREQVNAWKPEIEALAVATGIGPVALAKALYFVASSGIEAGKAMDVLTIAAKGSMAGMGDVEMLADVLTGSMNAYAKSNLTAADAMDILVRGIQVGKAEPAEFAAALGTIAPAASQLNVSFSDLVATMAVLSRVNSNTSENATSLGQIFNGLLKPTTDTTKALEDMGLSSAQLRDVLANQGPIAMLQLLASRMGDNDEAIATLFPNIRALRGVLNLMGQDGASVAEAFGKVADSAGALDGAVSAVSDDASVKFDKAMARLQVTLIHLGDTVIPKVTDGLDRLGGFLADATVWWDGLDSGTKDFIVNAAILLAVLGPLLKILGLLLMPIGLLVKGIGGLVALVGTVATAMGTTTSVAAYMVGIVGALAAAFVVLGLLIAGVVTNFNGMGDAFAKGIIAIDLLIIGLVQTVVQAAGNVMSVLAMIPGPFQGIAEGIRDMAAATDASLEETRQGLIRQVGAIDAAAAAAAAGADHSYDAVEKLRGAMNDPLPSVAGTVAGDMKAAQPAVDAAAAGIANALPNALTDAQPKVAPIVQQTLSDLSASLVSGQTDWQSAWSNYGSIMKNDLTKTQEIAQIKGILTGKALAKGLKSKDVEVRTAAEAMRAAAKERLFALQNDVPGIARKSGVSYADALEATKGAVKTAGGKLSKAAKDQLIMDLRSAGTNVGQSWAAGLGSRAVLAAVTTAAMNVSHTATQFLHGQSPPPEGPLHTIDKGGENVAKAWADGLVARLGKLRLDVALRPLARSFASWDLPGTASEAPAMQAPTSPASITIGDIHVTGVGSDVSPAAARRFSTSIVDEITTALRDQTARIGTAPI